MEERAPDLGGMGAQGIEFDGQEIADVDVEGGVEPFGLRAQNRLVLS